jgi:hypothetical protein
MLFLGRLIRSSCTILEETDFKRGRLKTYGIARAFYHKLAKNRYHCHVTVRYRSGLVVGDKLNQDIVVIWYPMLDSLSLLLSATDSRDCGKKITCTILYPHILIY